MVDKIKFVVDNAKIPEDILKKKFFSAINKKGSKEYLYKNNFVEEEEGEKDLPTENSTDRTAYENRYKKYLYIKYIVYSSPKKFPNNNYLIRSELIIHRNIRKDRFGEGTVHDLSYLGFLKIIDKYISDFGIDEKTMWNARVTKIELGVTLKLKSRMRGVLSCFESFNGITEKHIYGDAGISFIGNNFVVTFYDKLVKMQKSKELFKNSKNRAKLFEKVTKNNYFLRFELKIHKVSGFNSDENLFKKRIERLKEIRDNWNYLGKALFKMYEKVNYIDILSPEVEESFKGKEKKPMNDFLMFKGIKSVGKDRFFTQLIPLMKNEGNSQSKFKKWYRDFYNNYDRHYLVDYGAEFGNKLEDKLESLNKKD